MPPPLIRAREVRGILRDRDRKLSAYDQLVPGERDSKAPPPGRVSPSSCPTRRPLRPIIRMRKSRAKQLYADRIQERAYLMSNTATGCLDLTNIDADIGIDECVVVDDDDDDDDDDGGGGGGDESCLSQNDGRGLGILISVGFAGYSRWSHSTHAELPLWYLQSPADFRSFLLHASKSSLLTIGVTEEDLEISGYEVQFPSEYVSDTISFPAGERVLVRSRRILRAWAKSANEDADGYPILPRHIVMRIIKKDGTMFDPTFRQPEEPVAEPGMHNSTDGGDSSRVNHSNRGRRAARYRLASTKHDPVARQERVARQAVQRYEMYKLEHMMAHSNLSDGPSGVPTIPWHVSGPASDVPQQGNQTGRARNGLGGIEQTMKDLEMG